MSPLEIAVVLGGSVVLSIMVALIATGIVLVLRQRGGRAWSPFARAMMAVREMTPEERELFRCSLDEYWPPPPPPPPPNENITQ